MEHLDQILVDIMFSGGGNGGGYPPAGNPAVESTRPVGGGGYGVISHTCYSNIYGAGGDGLNNTGSGGGGTNIVCSW